MNDCPMGDVRDLLPDLLHGRLDAVTRASVASHVSGCADCQGELALLRDLRSTIHVAPSLDLGAISAAMPRYRAPVQRSWVGWRTAAAITVIVAGGSSVALIQRGPSSLVPASSVALPALRESALVVGPAPVAPTHIAARPAASAQRVDSSPVSPSAAVTAVAEAPAARSGRELAMGGGTLSDLSDRELASLLKDIESLGTVPTTEVESVTLAPIPEKPTP